MMLPSPVRLTMLPRFAAMAGSIRSLRRPRRRASVRSWSAPAAVSDDVGHQDRDQIAQNGREDGHMKLGADHPA
jgi:hypothetical protein